MEIILGIVLYVVIALALGAVFDSGEDMVCPKCGGELDYWDTRCKHLVCQTEGCDYSRKIW